MITTWHIITGEYPPQPGGVSDYSELLATGLVKSGCHVHVWCPGLESKTIKKAGVEVHHFGKSFSLGGLRHLGNSLNTFDPPRTLLVQYAPNAFGMRGLNLFFCSWLWLRSLFRRDDVRVMFHEPFFYFAWQRPQRNLLALVNRVMAVVLLASSHIVYVSIPAWIKMLRRYAWPRNPPMVWLPIPSTIPHVEDIGAVALIRSGYTNCKEGKLIVGHFGTYGDHITPELAEVFTKLLQAEQNAIGLCLGARGESFVANVIKTRPELEGRMIAPGFLSRDEVSLHLQACDLAIQPYPDGASSRRTSLMAALVNGTSTITTIGPLTEDLWKDAGFVPLANSYDTQAMLELALKFLRDEDLRRKTGEREQSFYHKHFDLERSIHSLLETARRQPNA